MEGIAIALVVSVVLALISRQLALPPIPFYILAGVALGQGGLALAMPSPITEFFGHLGLIFLLFYVGLDLKAEKFIGKGPSFVKIGLIDLHVNYAIGFIAALILGFSLFDAIIVAAAFYISSSVITFASLIEHRKLLTREAETIVLLMVFEDIVLVLLIVLLSAGVSIPLITLLEIVGMIVLFFGTAAIGRDQILRVLDRDDEIPVLITFSAVICTALFSQFLGIPDTLMAIVLGSALSTTTPKSLERNARPFKDVFLVMFFVFFGISVDFSGNIGLFPIAALSILAVVSKCISGIIIGRKVHGTTESGIEIWAYTIARGEFSIALAALYGSAMVSSTIAAVVIVTSIAGSVTSKISPVLKRVVYWHSRLSLSGSISLKW